MTIWNIIYLVGFVLYVAVRGIYKERTKKNEHVVRKVDGIEKMLMVFVGLTSLLLPLLYLFSPWLSFADYSLPVFIECVGITLMICALWLFWRSHADLGQNWSQTLELRKGHQIVRHGVYKRIRHPMYAAILLWCVAQGLVLENWLAGWAAFVGFALMYVVRTPREERMMIEHFGEEYASYKTETGRLVPRLQR